MVDHYFEQIEGWFNFRQAYRDAVAEAPNNAVFVEVGSYKGRSAVFMGVEIANSGKEISLLCVDHWKGSNEEAHQADPDRKRLFTLFKENIAPLIKAHVQIKPIRSDSVQAAHLFEDESVDFVWIDAGHDYDSVSEDIEAWWPKVKRGGVMGGDDLPMVGVNQAVTELFPDAERVSESGWMWWRVRKPAA
jgi:predicted O-methyltransferase YrrM